MKPALQLKLSQQLKLTPQLQQSIRLLQLSTSELNQEIERIVQENPLLGLYEDWSVPARDSLPINSQSPDLLGLEKVPLEAVSLESTLTIPEENHIHDFERLLHENFFSKNAYEDEDYDTPQIPDKALSLREYLNLQVSCFSHISERERRITGLLIDSLDHDGYLSQSLNELLEVIPADLDTDLDNLQNALNYLQRLDPLGVGARDLRECLTLQLQALLDSVAYRDQALRVVQEHLQICGSHGFTQVKRLLACDEQGLIAIQKLITHLNPRSGDEFITQNGDFIVLDIVVTKSDGIWVADLDTNTLPKFGINYLCANILKQEKYNVADELLSQLDEAQWLIRSIQQRSSTILNVAKAIVARQQQFFEHGEVAMRPLVLREIVETWTLYESTVSRITTQQFMHTSREILEFKCFFGNYVYPDSGRTCSATVIRAFIKRLIQEEDSKKPLTDNAIANILAQQGIIIACLGLSRNIVNHCRFLQ